MTSARTRRYWHRFIADDGTWRKDSSERERRPVPQDLAVFRSGLGREAGAVPKFWPYYTTAVTDDDAYRDRLPDELLAEHAALALFGRHQQSKDTPMHRRGVGLGAAWLVLRRRTDKFSAEALDRKLTVAAASTSVPVLRTRLRGLIDQLRTVDQPLDYDRLLCDLRDWADPSRRDTVRKRWALGYRIWSTDPAIELEN
ncbi:hypothetical protein GCM10027271_42340 [Saccharopolyspora gloriosae]|uniref:CRISPR system Cascade subunit CasB n=1 Tax=Saccharopolyspora gloriosae TaxID=455344 RepID=A0A840NEW8_9PSEU|nr:type I-E CRISPR-associated protein Cse2/CasB [Saccharopolyspora gloriosae]MBB5070470.1 CRISPR system Cascade subunit CasB [Saccharopolyspora gloriosae]